MPLSSGRYPLLLLSLSLVFAVIWIAGCGATRSTPSSAASEASDSTITDYIPYEEIDRRNFVDAGVRVRTTEGNRVSVEAAEGDTLVWFENEHTGQFVRAFLRRGNTIYVLMREGDYYQGSPSESVAYRLFMQAWHQADTTGEAATLSGYADER